MRLDVVTAPDRVAKLLLGGGGKGLVAVFPVAPDAGDVGEEGERRLDPLAGGQELRGRLDQHLVLGQEVLAQVELVIGRVEDLRHGSVSQRGAKQAALAVGDEPVAVREDGEVAPDAMGVELCRALRRQPASVGFTWR